MFDLTKRPKTLGGKIATGLVCMFGVAMLDTCVIVANAKLTDTEKNKQLAMDAMAVTTMVGLSGLFAYGASEWSQHKKKYELTQ
ncbi:MAG TPA: hypothetical protein VGF14_05000 [Alphaproteobacteria bacterium]